MSRVVFELTVRQLAGRGRTLLMLALAFVPVMLAIIFRFAGDEADRQEFVAEVLYAAVVVTLVLPLTALVYGTAVLGAEIEDGTAVYIFAKPIARAKIVISKLLAAWLATVATVATSGLLAGSIVLAGTAEDGILIGFTVGLLCGALAYSALFIFLSVLTSRALIAGLAYVFIWENLINGLFTGTRILSVRHYTLGIADIIVDVPDRIFEAPLSPAPAVIAMALMATLATWLAVRRVERFEIGESS
jgi:ABC-2 type transport system permease protein